ncbi:copper-containing nitrite reductase [Stappia sp. 28M-7]|uniref:copper-containing nitrite reductase n=1 Tax=Stappia sp. 28M-7 TaxID=2762596 RepID=UPI00163B7DC5|nr:copper-containing nitrite reductase [Stappia sp. 28M-7]MBC2859641.1 nitrite reductase, copper-containing [Stappia sp. 28M-7]
MITRRTALIGTAMATLMAVVPVLADETANPTLNALDLPDQTANLERVQATLVAPPAVMDHDRVATGAPKIVEFTMTIEEKTVVVDDQGTTFQAMTFNGTMPGPTMVVHEGDYVELTLVNPETNEMPHNIDFHAATGALGGAALTLINPGEQATLRFKATRTGTFVYHCAPPGMVPWHVVSGMSGTLMVLPRDGLKDERGTPVTYDTAYTIGEFDLYIPKDEHGNYMTFESVGESYADTLEVMRGLIPTHVVFNGAKNSLTGDKAMTAKVGERVMFIHSTANRDTRPHLIGGHGDLVWETGKFANPPERDLETWFVRGGSAAVAIYEFLQPGIYAYVNHNLIEAAELGATGHVKVEGEWNNDLMMQVSAPAPIAVQ